VALGEDARATLSTALWLAPARALGLLISKPGGLYLFRSQVIMRTDHAAQIWALPIATSDGEFIAHYSREGLCGLDFPSGGKRPKPRAAAVPLPSDIRRWHALATKALARALQGQEPEALPPLDWTSGTGFQRGVWRVLRKIKPGQTRSYAAVARDIRNPKAVRAVGGACGANPIPVLVPCHRILATNHRLGGFSGGLDWKRTLLAREGVKPPA
jgi:AraC family transcriptional regulator, regulatory protein of adaptative response / methylated-DNA-[protein]-cysteine methyltransferase